MISFAEWEQHHKQEKWAEEVDQLEWSASVLGTSPFEASQLDDEIADLLVEADSLAESEAVLDDQAGATIEERVERKLLQAEEEAERTEKKTEDLTAGMQAEAQRRSEALGEDYPFSIDGSSLSYRGGESRSHKIYMECLKTSVAPTPEDREAFEHLVGRALRAYLGYDRAIIKPFGWQREAEADQPRRIRDMVTGLHKETNEWRWSPDVGFPENPPPTLVKDLGIDTFAWLPMPDKRPGKLFVVAQCATGRTNWDAKLTDVDWNRITNWIRPIPNQWSIRCFAIPFHLPNDARWLEVSGLGGLFLDRCRLTLLLKDV